MSERNEEPHYVPPGAGRFVTRREVEDMIASSVDENIKRHIEGAVDDGVSRAISRFGLIFGIDATNAAGVLDAQKDWMHLRSWRRATDSVKQKGIGAAAIVIVTSLMGGILLWLKTIFMAGSPPR